MKSSKKPVLWPWILVGAVILFIWTQYVKDHHAAAFSALYSQNMVPAHMETNETLLGSLLTTIGGFGTLWGFAQLLGYAQRRWNFSLFDTTG
jgi:hypothetical protein